MGHAHRLSAMAFHDLQGGRVVFGAQQGDLTADQLCVLTGPAL
jgi:hypothetical protein